MRIEKDATRRNLTVTHSTLQRMLTGEGAHLDKLEDVAAYFGTDVWELLCPDSEARHTPTLSKALEVVALHLNQLPDDRRELVAQHLQTLARAPDSQRAMESLLASMQHIAGPMPTAESRDFQPPVPSGLFDKTKQPS